MLQGLTTFNHVHTRCIVMALDTNAICELKPFEKKKKQKTMNKNKIFIRSFNRTEAEF